MTVYDSNHEGLQTEPWTAELLEWLRDQSKGLDEMPKDATSLTHRSLRSHVRAGKERMRKIRS